MASQGDSGSQVPTGKAKKGPVRRTRRWLSTEKPLSHALLAVVVFGLIVAFIAWVLVSWILGQGLPWTSATEDTTRLDITKLALTVVGGAGAFVALTVAYRRQKDIEDGRFTERFGAAAAQLGATTPAERLAGVYAMAGVADRYPAFAQQCIDVLCGYLRLPFDPDPAESHLTSIVRHRKVKANGPDVEDRTYERRPNDREVRDSIIRVIAAHVHKDRETGWHQHDFDLTAAVLTTAEFRNAQFRGTLNCTRVKFIADADFTDAQFSGDVRFPRATFSRVAWFTRTTFLGIAWFNNATFTGAQFGEARFIGDALFNGARFTGGAWFAGATFAGDAEFTDARFTSLAWFGEAKFTSSARFSGATFTNAWFDRASLTSDAGFVEATFSGELHRQDGTTTVGTEQPLGPALGFPDPVPDDESEAASG